MSPTAAARFAGVSKRYGRQPEALTGLDLEIRQGEFLTLLGPSGSGKTTCLMLLAGFEEASAGEIFLEGRAVNGMPPHQRGIGVVFQSFALFPHMTVAQNLAFPLEMRNAPKSEIPRQVAAALSIMRLDGLEARRPSELSGGQQQRVALARALIFQPKLVLMDEPLGALDKQLRDQMQLELKRIHRSLGVSFVYVTHDQSEALTLSDRIAILSEGRLRQVGTTEEVYNAPASAFVASFIGEANMLPGAVEALTGSHCSIRLDNGPAIEAAAPDFIRPGQRVIVSLRPEAMRLGAAAPGVNHFDTRVDSVLYQGDHRKLTLTVPEGMRIQAKSGGGEGARSGDAVNVSFAAEACRVFPAEGQA